MNTKGKTKTKKQTTNKQKTGLNFSEETNSHQRICQKHYLIRLNACLKITINHVPGVLKTP